MICMLTPFKDTTRLYRIYGLENEEDNFINTERLI
jgi:hypothetical protein